ncbi:putative quinol monooxygenase [Actinoplanes sp. NPDC000266]
MPYAVIAHYRCAPPDADLVREALLKMRAHTRDEPANLLYELHTDPEDPAVFVIYEQYTDRAGFETHAATPHFTEYILDTIRPRLTDRQVFFGDVITQENRNSPSESAS